MTESYSSSQDPPEKSIPICTLKNFPNKIDHTLQWARDLFEGIFSQTPENVNMYLRQPDFVAKTLKQPGSQPVETFNGIRECLVDARPLTFADCCAWARLRFEELYANQIKQLLFNFPADRVTESGAPFWSGPKRCPTPLVFDSANPHHVGFVVAAANLRAVVFGLKGSRDPATVLQHIQGLAIPAFKPRSGVKIETDEKRAQEQAQAGAGAVSADEGELQHLVQSLPSPSDLAGFKLEAQDFEKDDDSNFHMDFITAASNCRALNYSIEPADKHTSKGIAGKIIPAIATTTALVAGLVCVELCKVVAGHKKLESYKNAFLNLALPFVSLAEPIACQKLKYGDTEWTLWDRFELNGDMTVQQLIDYFQNEHGLEVGMLSYDVSLLYSSFAMTKEKRAARLAMTIQQAVEDVTKGPLPPHVKHLVLEISADDADGEEVDTPYVLYKLP
jgi:ubiquitin-activating enzyme E1